LERLLPMALLQHGLWRIEPGYSSFFALLRTRGLSLTRRSKKHAPSGLPTVLTDCCDGSQSQWAWLHRSVDGRTRPCALGLRSLCGIGRPLACLGRHLAQRYCRHVNGVAFRPGTSVTAAIFSAWRGAGLSAHGANGLALTHAGSALMPARSSTPILSSTSEGMVSSDRGSQRAVGEKMRTQSWKKRQQGKTSRSRLRRAA
jgi:hypothetical protein